MAKIISLDLGDGLTTDPVFRPSMISREHMGEIFSNVPEAVKIYARQLRDSGWRIYAVNQSRGRCYGGSQKVITLPVWAIVRGRKDPGFKTWYIAHECAHAMDNCKHSHGPEFMSWLKQICPDDCIHHEIGYKPRNAFAAGIKEKLIDF